MSTDHGNEGGHGHHEPQAFIWKYVFSVDHKVIGIQYLITSFIFLLIGFCMMLLMRYQLAMPAPGDDFDPEKLGLFRSALAAIFGENDGTVRRTRCGGMRSRVLNVHEVAVMVRVGSGR